MITLQTIRDLVRGSVAPLRERLRGLVVRGVVKVLSEGSGLQRAQIVSTADEVDDGVEIIASPGLTSRPAAGVEALVFSVNGNPGHRVALLFDRRSRFRNLAEDEAALHIGHGDQVVLLKANGDVQVLPDTGGEVVLGGADATKHVALAPDVQARLDALKTAINAWVPVPQDGGAALKVALTGWLAGSNAVGSTNVKAKG